MSPSGGKREGAGKPALYGKAMKRINVMLDPETIAFYIEYGEGNLSEGIRKYWQSLTKRASDVACATSYHDAFIIVYGYCPVCSGKTPRR